MKINFILIMRKSSSRRNLNTYIPSKFSFKSPSTLQTRAYGVGNLMDEKYCVSMLEFSTSIQISEIDLSENRI